jgi:RimJ/RimL family protein N-acetyltransferase
MTDLEFMAIQAETLYRVDQNERLLSVNEPSNPPAPRLFLGRTRGGHLWRFRYDLPADLARELERLCRSEPVSADLPAQLAGYQAMRAALRAHGEIRDEWRGPAYRFPDQLDCPEHVLLIAEQNAQALLPRFARLAAQLGTSWPCIAVVEEGMAVSVCFSSRISDRAAEAGVETPPRFRRRGYAAAAVAGWAAEVRRSGRIPLYSASWANIASQGVARKLGLVMYGEDISIA